jgi:hypothetical protein
MMAMLSPSLSGKVICMRVTRVLLLFSAVLGMCAAASAQDVVCPESVVVRQELNQRVAGWEPFTDDVPLRLSFVTFYDGPPKDRASLVNTFSHKQGPLETATWEFRSDGDRHIWLACSYAATTIALMRELPSNVTSCAVTYNPRERVSGMPAIEKIACK